MTAPARPPLPGERVTCPVCGQSVTHVRVPTDAEMFAAGTEVALLYGRCTYRPPRGGARWEDARSCDTWLRVVRRAGRAAEVRAISEPPRESAA